MTTQPHRKPIPSTWRDPVGPLLTDHRVSFYEAEGRYGPGPQAKALSITAARAERKAVLVARDKNRKRIQKEYR